MVRLVFRPYTQVRRTICTSVSLRASTRVSSGFAPLRHSSPSFGSRQACSHSNPSQKIKVGRRCNPLGDPANQLPCALRVWTPVDSHTCQTPWSVFQDGSNGEPAGRRPEHAKCHEGTPKAHAAHLSRGDDISTGPKGPGLGRPHDSRRSTLRVDWQTSITVPHPTGAHRRPPSASLPTISSTL